MDTYKKASRGDYKTALPYVSLLKNKVMHDEYVKDENRLVQQFKNDLFEEFDVTNNPKRDLCYAKAWEHGHSAGLAEVANYFSDFVELIK